MSKDVISDGPSWAYTQKVKEHFFHPRNFMVGRPKKGYFDAVGQAGSLACGDVMKIWIKIDPKEDRVVDFKWRTFGCASALAATSVFSEMVLRNGGLTISEAIKITSKDIMEELGGLPARKAHCSVLADRAFRQTLNNYFRSRGEHHRVITDGSKIIDADLNITEQDIAKAVRDGAKNLNDVQASLKVGVGNPEVRAEVERLIEFYRRQTGWCSKDKQ